MTIYIDISQLERARSNTGIQRVLKEFLQRMISENSELEVKVVSQNASTKVMESMDNKEILLFLKDVTHYQFQNREILDIENSKVTGVHIFFDIDSVWSVELKREKLYPKLKANGFLIFNFLHDLIPLVMPNVVHEVTIMHFEPFLDAVYQHSDMVFFNSHSSKRDFLERKEMLKIERHIPSRVVGLGSDFLELSGSFDKKFSDNILDKKYILFVGTIEPRKNQKEMLDAFEILAQKYSDLHLVIIGKEGWNVQNFINRLQNHPLKNTQLHWFSGIDDNLLKQFYKNAFIVTYLSKYEGYGLPIVESLQFGNITITSKNSSMQEAGRDFADYLLYNSQNELVDIISLYYENKPLYYAKKNYIRQNFKVLSWDKVYGSLSSVLLNYQKAENLKEIQKKNSIKELQFVFISISFESIEATIKLIDKHMRFAKEYVVVTQPKLVEKFKTLTTDKKLTIIDETEILKAYQKDFHLRDHQSKNWLLRVSLLNLEILDEQFIMLDDDNRPLKDIPIDFFISKDGCYNAYYFYNLLEWNHKGTAYDLGQHSTKKVLTEKNYELLSYSSHAPQIINRKILQEVASQFFEIGLNQPIDEWSIYFNYAISTYPSLFKQNIFQTLNWPDTPLSWEYSFIPKSYSFENYYEKVYTNGLFQEETSYEEKVAIKSKEIAPYSNSRKLFQKNISMLSKENMTHGQLHFKRDNLEFYLFGIPYLLVIEESSDIRLKINYKLLNPNEEHHDIVIAILLFGKPRTYIKFQGVNTKSYQEGIIELPIVTQELTSIVEEYPLPSELLTTGMHNLSFDIIVNKRYVYGTKSPYLIKLMVITKEQFDEYTKEVPQKMKISINHERSNKKELIKESIKKIPLLGWFTRWSNNLLRLNRLAVQHYDLTGQHQHFKTIHQQQIEQLTELIEKQQKQIDNLLKKNNQMKSQVSKEINTQAILFKNRIEEFINQSNGSDIDKKEILEEQSTSFLLDDFYLAFENRFRGSREEIEQRYHSYLKYLNSHIKTALDIGCGRGEWVGLLQKNGIQAEGIDLNFAMLNDGTYHGIKNLQKINAFDFFKTCDDNSFDLITAFHIIEHIPYEQLFIFLQEIKRISTPNAVILLETPNPANILVGAFEFYKDPTHLNPLPDDVMKFTVEYMGFEDVTVEKLHSFPEHMKIEEHSQTAQHFNHFFYQERDYLIIARNGKGVELDGQTRGSAPTGGKPKLAFVSPMPPTQSGIAYYSAELLPALSNFYDIDIIDKSSIERFKQHHNEYHRVLYHFGNSAFHIEMIELLEQCSGVIVLHDFYLSNLMAKAGKLNPNLRYKEHGYQTLLNNKNYPCNQTILNQSIGVIVHSEYPKNMLKEWYSNSYLSNWSTVPLLRTPPKKDEILLTKEMLNLPKDAFVVCSFGLLRPNKKNHELLLAWQNSTLHQDPNCYLVFVGNNQEETAYGKKLLNAISSQIRITDWVDDITFKSYLSHATLAIQLRTNSTGETSATILDCMNHKIPLIINANGSNQELPADTVLMLEDDFQVSDLTQALELLYTNNQKRTELSSKAKEHIEQYHTPSKCAKLYHQSIEEHYNNRDSYKQASIQNLNQESFLYSDFTKIRQKQILVDVSTIIRNDLKTGIERVVRSQIIELIKNAPAYIRIEPVYLSFDGDNSNYFYAREYTVGLLKGVVGGQHPTVGDEPVNVNRGDVFYGLDLCAKEVNQAVQSNLYQHYKSLGVKITFMVYDLLPITKPHLFPANMEGVHQQWFEDITSVADQLICISDKVAKEVISRFDFIEQASKGTSTMRSMKSNLQKNIKSLHLGADLETEALAPNSARLKPSVPITFLMVGTVEPRKRHQEVLEAFETLWEKGLTVHLKIVGKDGWGMQEFIQKLTQHKELNQKLFYLSFVDDRELNYLYASANALIVASEDEGFGLPLIEGAKYGIPIIARDIEVFREVAGAYAFYFKDNNLSKDIERWIGLYENKQHPSSEQMPYLTWKENVIKLLEML